MKIKKYYLTKSDNTRRMEKIEKVKKVIITSSKYRGFSGLKNRNIIEMSKYKDEREFSCHYIIGNRGEVLNIIPENERAICTRNESIDTQSISIMLSLDSEGRYTENEMKTLRELVLKIVERYNLKLNDVQMEYDINCSRRPKMLVDEPIMLDDILKKKPLKLKL